MTETSQRSSVFLLMHQQTYEGAIVVGAYADRSLAESVRSKLLTLRAEFLAWLRMDPWRRDSTPRPPGPPRGLEDVTDETLFIDEEPIRGDESLPSVF